MTCYGWNHFSLLPSSYMICNFLLSCAIFFSVADDNVEDIADDDADDNADDNSDDNPDPPRA